MTHAPRPEARAVVLCVQENWTTAPMSKHSAEALIARGLPDCVGDHRVVDWQPGDPTGNIGNA